MKKIVLWLITAVLTIGCFTPVLAENTVTVPEMTDIHQYTIANETEAIRFVKQLGVGWNLGNTFDATNDGYVKDDLTIESYWCGIKTPEAIFDTIKEAGYSTVRIPISWHNHVDKDFNINEPWLNRVAEVVDWALDRDLFVIINIHHDNEKGYLYPSDEQYETAEKYITAIWSQVAAKFADRGDHLIFESMNEPRLKGTNIEWWFSNTDQKGLAAAENINKLNQVFVNTVRAAGGENATRYLMVPGYCASPNYVLADFFRLPEDTIADHLIVSAHAYTPYAFALDLKGTDTFTLDNIGFKSEITTFMTSLFVKYVKNGVPVVIGEFGALNKRGNLQDRVDFTAFYVANASARCIPAIWWDNHNFTGGGEQFGILDRKTAQWAHPEIVEAMIKYGGYDAIPPLAAE